MTSLARGVVLTKAATPKQPATFSKRCASVVKHRDARPNVVLSAWSGGASSRPGETLEETLQRRARETEAVDQRTITIHSRNELDAFLAEAGDNLVFLNVETESLCDVGTDTNDPAACARFNSSVARVARECSDVTFLKLEVEDDVPASQALAKELGVSTFPTQQYYRCNQLVWQHVGAGEDALQSVGQGVLYYGNQGAGGVHADDYVTEVKCEGDFTDFLEMCALGQENDRGVMLDVQCEKQLAILDVSVLNNAAACMQIFPAVTALAKNTAGAIRWARLLGDSSPQAAALAQKFNVTSFPTFIFFADGVEVDRVMSSDRMELMNHVLAFQQKNGVKMPQPPARKRISIAEAKEIAKAKRAAQKKVF